MGEVAKAERKADLWALLGERPERAHVEVLDRLRCVLHQERSIAWQVVEDDDLDAVLNIFIRANTKGTQLRYDDMLLAIANATWQKHDANVAVKDLRSDLHGDFGMAVTQTRIMKTALVLTGAPQVGFRATNLTRARLRAIDDDWDEINKSIWVATKVLHRFGIRQRTLTAENVLVPIASYVHHRGLDARWVDSGRSTKDLERVRQFAFRSMLKPDFWTGAVDPLLLLCRKVIVERPRQAQFPLAEIVSAVERSRLGKRLDFTDDDIGDLLRTRYRDRHSLLLLTALYPEAARQGWLDKDHIFPRSKVNPNALRVAGLPSGDLSRMRDRAEQLPNLCLLSTDDNRWWKQARLPNQWLEEVKRAAGPAQRSNRVRFLDLQRAPSSIAEAEDFWTARESRLRRRLAQILTA